MPLSSVSSVLSGALWSPRWSGSGQWSSPRHTPATVHVNTPVTLRAAASAQRATHAAPGAARVAQDGSAHAEWHSVPIGWRLGPGPSACISAQGWAARAVGGMARRTRAANAADANATPRSGAAAILRAARPFQFAASSRRLFMLGAETQTR